MTEIETSLLGVKEQSLEQVDRQSLLLDCDNGDLLYIDGPSSKADSGLFMVRTASGENIGYLPMNVAKKIAHQYDNGDFFSLFIDELTGDYGQIDCKIKVMHDTGL